MRKQANQICIYTCFLATTLFCSSFIQSAWGSGWSSGDSNRRLYTTFECPAMHPEYVRLMGQIRGLKQKVEEKAECGTLRSQVDSLADYVGTNRASFVAEVTKKSDRMLTVEESRRLQSYANEASKRALFLIDLLNGDDGCVEEETKGQLLSRTSSIVYEAGNLLSSVAGPYGVPIAMTSSVISGVLKGVFYFYENQSGFDFDEFEQRQFYAESVCQFYRFQQEAEELVNPVATLGGLQKLKDHLVTKLNELTSNCTECAEMMIYYADDYNRQDEDVFNQRVEEFRVSANKLYVKPLGNVTLQTLRTMDWIQEQMSKYQTILSQERASQGLRELMRESLQMSSFLFEEWAPDFLRWHFRSAHKEYREFQVYVHRWSTEVWMDVINNKKIVENGLRRVPSMPLIYRTRDNLDFIKANQNELEKQFRVRSKWRKQGQLVQLSLLSMQVLEEYCGFFQLIMEYNNLLATQCESRGVKRLKEQLAIFSPSSPPPLPLFFSPLLLGGERSWQSAMDDVISRWDSGSEKFAIKDRQSL